MPNMCSLLWICASHTMAHGRRKQELKSRGRQGFPQTINCIKLRIFYFIFNLLARNIFVNAGDDSPGGLWLPEAAGFQHLGTQSSIHSFLWKANSLLIRAFYLLVYSLQMSPVVVFHLAWDITSLMFQVVFVFFLFLFSSEHCEIFTETGLLRTAKYVYFFIFLFFAVTNILCTHSSWYTEVTIVFKWIWLALSKPYSHFFLKFDFKQIAAIKQGDAWEMQYELSNSYNL